jgi:hypothetical protein
MQLAPMRVYTVYDRRIHPGFDELNVSAVKDIILIILKADAASNCTANTVS